MNKRNKDLPIGVMDSGLGGLSVLRKAIKIMPNEDYIYYGDSANAPYGTKTQKEIRDLTFAVVDKLLAQGIKGLLVACNTATSAAVRELRQTYPDLPIVGIEPAIKPAVMSNHGGRILVMATPMTLRQEKFNALLAKYNDQAKIVPVPCKGMMEFVEAGVFDNETLGEYFTEHLGPYLTEDTETIVLGCTHYPFLKNQIRHFLGNKNIELIDGSLGTSMELKRQLKEKDLLKDDKKQGNIYVQNSLDKKEIIDLSWKLINLPYE